VNDYRAVTRCRMCHSDRLEPFLDLGMTPLADAFVMDPNAPEMTYPLLVLLCVDCGLAQLSVAVSPAVLYDESYVYEASATTSGRQHFADLAQRLVTRFDGRFIVDIGCNDGVLLEGFKRAAPPNTRICGIDPALTMGNIARRRGLDVYTHIFDRHAAHYVADVVMQHKADIVTATNVFAHVDDLESFIQALDVMLAPEGVFVIEAPHFLRLVQGMEYDTIYHEHVSYLTVGPVEAFFARHGFRLFDVEPVGIHGGSLRYYVDRGLRNLQAGGVRSLIADEVQSGIADLEALRRWGGRVHEHQRELVRTLERFRNQGLRIAGVSAPAKGMTLLNTSHAGDYLEFLTEKPGGLKVGRYAPGSRLPVKDDSALISEGIDCALILAWNFADEVAANQRGYGGAFLRPIPAVERVVVAA
jgi:SAM-dependent methyltransferase